MANASSARRNAIEQYGRMAGEMRNTDYNQAAEIARAKDERNKFLAQNSIERQRQNIGAQNTAQQDNLAQQQRANDANVAMANDEKRRQAEAERQHYQDQLKFVAGKTGQQQLLAGYYGNTANAKAKAQVDMGKGIGGLGEEAATAYATGGMSEAIPKKGIS
jgi:hypothetical protein